MSRGFEPDPHRETVIALGIALALVAFGVMGWALWSGEATDETSGTTENYGLEPQNDTEPIENASDGNRSNDGTDNRQVNETDTQGDSGETETSGNETETRNTNETAPPPALNETNETRSETNGTGTNDTNETAPPSAPNETNETPALKVTSIIIIGVKYVRALEGGP